MGKQSGSNVGKIVIKLRNVTSSDAGWAAFPYIDAAARDEGGWDVHSRQRDAKTFDTVGEAIAWVDSAAVKGLREYCEGYFRLAFVRIVPRKASK